MTPTDPIYGLIALSAVTSWGVFMYLYFAWQLSGWLTDRYIEWKLRRFHKINRQLARPKHDVKLLVSQDGLIRSSILRLGTMPTSYFREEGILL